jgi:hypothetical protein
MYHECRHILPGGKRCESPALREQAFCYYHTRSRRYLNAGANLPVNSIEDHRGIQLALAQLLGALNSPQINTSRARLTLSSLRFASEIVNRMPVLDPRATVRATEESAETTGETQAPDKTVCEPPEDCGACPSRDSCKRYKQRYWIHYEVEKDEKDEEDD